MNYKSLKSSRFLKRLVIQIRKASPIEKLLFASILFFFLVGFLLAVERVSDLFSVRIPIQGGIVKEGIIGFPTNINPIFASSNADHDLVSLVYSGLLRVSEDGDLIPDLAEKFSVSEDELDYTFTLRGDIYFHDGTPITAGDVVFTIEQIRNPTMGSPLINTQSGVAVREEDPATVVFSLERPYAGFLAEMTVGIVPKHIWENVPPSSLKFIELSSYPVGSGPFRVSKVKRSESLGVPTHYTLTSFEKYKKRRPYLNGIELSFYASEEELVGALKRGDIGSAPFVSPASLSNLLTKRGGLKSTLMLRTFGLFFNQDESSVLADQSVRRAINAAVDRGLLAESIFSGYAEPTTTPLPFRGTLESSGNEGLDPNELLDDAGWEINNETGVREKDGEKLSFTIRTVGSEDLRNTAIFVQETLRSAGFDVEVETFDVMAFNQSVIRQRDYEALLFGQAYGRFIDLYPFWHSSNRNDPGLNIARYVSSDVDEVVVALRKETNAEERQAYLDRFLEELKEEVPAVFLYAPHFLYITDNNVHNVKIPQVERSSDRFSNVEDWFMYTDTVWKIFVKKQKI